MSAVPSILAHPSTLATRPDWRRLARRHLPKAQLEPGSGPWVSVSECAPYQTVHFHSDEPSAKRAVDWLDSTGCGGRGCRRAGTGLAAHWTMPLGED